LGRGEKSIIRSHNIIYVLVRLS